MFIFRDHSIPGFTLDHFPALMPRTQLVPKVHPETVSGREVSCPLTLVQSLLYSWVMHTPL